MPPITPDKPTGALSSAGSMIVVVCTNCRQKRWAILLPKEYHKARTTCCAVIVSY